MNESPIDQLYCTHCTYGTSALYRADDARKEQVFEYSTRAASVERNRTHQLFQFVELYIKYQLPGDIPASEMLRYTAETSPWQRLAYFPAISGSRVLTRSCYRQTDTRNRPGSYFAHVLLSECVKAAPAWNAIDGLKLWGSPGWASTDSPQLPFDLPQAVPFSNWPGFAEAINDEALLSFLETPPGDPFALAVTDEADSVVPVRWRLKPVAERRQLLIDVLGTVMQLNFERHEKLVIAVESGLAALLFYGAFRLLPAQGFAEKISFSTYQSHLENPTTTLAACSFFNPEVADLLPDAYRGAAINTFNGRRGQGVRSAQYAAATYLVENWAKDERSRLAVDSLLSTAGRVGVAQPRDFEELIAADGLVGRLLTPNAAAPLGDRELPTAKVSRQYLQQSVTGELAKLPSDSGRWKSLTTVPGHALLLVKLLGAAEATPEALAMVEKICRLLPPQEYAQILTAAGVSDELKMVVLVRYFSERGELPPECDFIWNSQPRAGAPRDLVARLLKRLDTGARERLLASLVRSFDSQTPTEWEFDSYKTAVRALLAGFDENEAATIVRTVLWPPACYDSFVMALLQDPELSGPVLRECPVDEPVLGPLVARVLDELPNRPNQFRGQLNILKATERFLEPARKQEFLAWNSIAGLLTRVGQNLKEPVSWLKKVGGGHSKSPVLAAEREDLANWVQKALPESRFPGDYEGKERAKLVAEIARAWLTPTDLPAEFVEIVSSALCGTESVLQPISPIFATATMQKPHSSSSRGKQVYLVLGISLIVMLGAVGTYFVPQIRRAISLTSSETKRGPEDPTGKQKKKTPGKVEVARKDSRPDEKPAQKRTVGKASPKLHLPKDEERDSETKTAIEDDRPDDEPSSPRVADNSPGDTNGMPSKPAGEAATEPDNDTIIIGEAARDNLNERDINAHKKRPVLADGIDLTPLAKRLGNGKRISLRLGCKNGVSGMSLHGPLVIQSDNSSDSIPKIDGCRPLYAESNPPGRQLIVSTVDGSGQMVPFAYFDFSETPTVTLVPIGLKDGMDSLASLRTCVLQVMYNEQFPRAYYFSFASTQRVRSGRFRDDLTILLPSEGRLFDGDSNLVVADSVEFVAINQTRRKLRLGSQGTYVQSLLFPQKDAQDLGFGGVEIDLREGNVHLKSSLRNLNDGAAKDEVAALDNKKDILDDALWDLTAAWHGKGRSSSQKGKFPPSRLPQPDKHPVAARSTFRVKVALADASKKAAALAEELGQTPFRGVPASLAVNADPAEQSKWLEEFATWYIEWGKHLGDLFNAYPKKRNELVASRARTNEKNGKSREGDQSEQALIGSVFVGDVFCVIEGTVNSTGKLQCGILIELVKYRDDQQSADPNASSDAKSQK